MLTRNTVGAVFSRDFIAGFEEAAETAVLIAAEPRAVWGVRARRKALILVERLNRPDRLQTVGIGR